MNLTMKTMPLDDEGAVRKFAKFLMRTVAVAALVTSPASLKEAIAQQGSKPQPVGSGLAQSMGDDLGITISVDGETIVGNQVSSNNRRNEDMALDNVDIQVKYDGLDVRPLLNVATTDLRRSYNAGQPVRFLATSNYPAWIERQEVRLFARQDGFEFGKQGKSGKPEAVLPVGSDGIADWIMPDNGADEYIYVLRVYDSQGHFDETVPLDIVRTSRHFSEHKTSPAEEAVSPGNGDDRTAFRNIPVHGGAVTIYGGNVPAGYQVKALGEIIPVDNENAFIVQRILPPGEHSVDVSIVGDKQKRLEFSRDVNIPANDWFFVGLADLTVGKKFGSAKLVAADPTEYDGIYQKGRLAFYLKGKVKGKYLITASADTGEGKLKDMFRRLDGKNPRQLLRRIDPDKYYPVYGDDSTTIEDAPTSGKFYVRVERGGSRVMWGNFRASINGGQLIRNERALYGANLVLRTEATTGFGERKAEVTAYAARPGTLPQRDVMRGTGGSAYFLKRQDISSGSETVTVEIRDSVSGLITSRRTLVYGEDYTINYVQGVIILSKPLPSMSRDGVVVSDGSLGDNDVNLVVQYEYTPGIGEVDGYSYGGRGQAWVNDHIRVGVTGMSETTGSVARTANQNIVGADFRLRKTATTYLEGEFAGSKGPGFGRSGSTDGGLTIVDTSTSGNSNRTAQAWSLRGQLDLADFGDGKIKGKIGAWYDHKEAGFSTLDHDISVTQTVMGVNAEIEVSESTRLRAAYEDFRDIAGKQKTQISGEVIHGFRKGIEVTVGAKQTELRNTAVGSENGNRADIGAKLAYTRDEDQSYYIFAQLTAKRDGNIKRNDRIGVGLKKQVTEKIGTEAEISHGTSGIGALAALTYDPTADDQYYMGYKLDPGREHGKNALNGTDRGGIVLGTRRTLSDELTAHAENKYDMFGLRRSLTSTYGVTYTPDKVWTYSGGAEAGRVRDHDATDFDRTAVSLGVSYNDDEKFTGRLRGELRFENSDDNTRDRNTYLLSAGLGIQYAPAWRLLADLDTVISNSDQSSILDGDYVEGSLGIAYRPVENDRFNGLFKYTFLYDLPGPDQVNSVDKALGPRQKSHVFSADGTYEFNDYLDIGAKYGIRLGQSESTRGSGTFTANNAHLGVLRADVHVIAKWDVLLEGRVLHSSSARTTDYGALAALYHHVGKNMKTGIGYNFGHFSDDLTDLTYDDKGLFMNLVGKF